MRVTAISPGAVQTEFSNIRFKVGQPIAHCCCCGCCCWSGTDLASLQGDKAAADAVYGPAAELSHACRLTTGASQMAACADGFVPLGPKDIADNVIYAATR